MTSLKDRHCAKPDGLARLDEAQCITLLKQLDGWSINERGELERPFVFHNYYETITFVNAVAWIAQQEDHHPDLHVSYKRCIVSYITHAVKGLSDNDFICAAKIDALLRGADCETEANG